MAGCDRKILPTVAVIICAAAENCSHFARRNVKNVIKLREDKDVTIKVNTRSICFKRALVHFLYQMALKIPPNSVINWLLLGP